MFKVLKQTIYLHLIGVRLVVMYIYRMLPVGNPGGGRRLGVSVPPRQTLYLPLASLPGHDGLRLVHQAGRQRQVAGGGDDGGCGDGGDCTVCPQDGWM